MGLKRRDLSLRMRRRAGKWEPGGRYHLCRLTSESLLPPSLSPSSLLPPYLPRSSLSLSREFAKIEAATQHLALTILSQKAPAQRPPLRRPPPPPPSPFLGVASAEAPVEVPHGSPSLSPAALDTSTLDLFEDILLTPDSFCQTLPAGTPQVASDFISLPQGASEFTSEALGSGDQGQPTPAQAPRVSSLPFPPQNAQGGSVEPAALGCGRVDSWEAPCACDPQGILDGWGTL